VRPAGTCDVAERGPPSDPYEKPCAVEATHRLVHEDGDAFMCTKHARILRHMYEPGQLRKLRKKGPTT
jgi:hypothetical protein